MLSARAERPSRALRLFLPVSQTSVAESVDAAPRVHVGAGKPRGDDRDGMGRAGGHGQGSTKGRTLRTTFFATFVVAVAVLTVAGCGSSRSGSETTSDLSRAGREEPSPEIREQLGTGAAVEVVRLSDRRPSAEELRSCAAAADLVVCAIDACRADHVGCYGYARPTTPNIDRLAEGCITFERHFVPHSGTKPSTVSLFTGVYPHTHLAIPYSATDRDLSTMPKVLANAGFETALFSSNPVATPAMGVGTHFQHVFAAADTSSWEGDAGRPVELASREPSPLISAFDDWLSEAHRTRFFAYLHFLPPHTPYDAPQEMKAMFVGQKPPGAWQGGFPFPSVALRERGVEPPPLDEWVNLYDANLRWADSAVGAVEAVLRRHGVERETMLIVTSDHGEAFREHGYKFHGRGVYDELVWVPLLIRLPGEVRFQGSVTALTQTVDLLPTVLDVFGVEQRPDRVQGRSLVPLITGESERVRDFAFATCGGDPASYLVRNDEYALILYEGGLHALYDLKGDPQQRRNIFDRHPERARDLVEAFRAFAESQALPPLQFIDSEWRPAAALRARELELPAQQRRELEALGYMH